MASLLIVEGVGEGRHLPITQPLVSVGRDDTCTFQILDPLVSRKHLQIRLEAKLGGHVAGDYRSAHGVFVNDKQVLLDVALHDGDKIKIGNTTLVYLAEDHVDANAAMTAAKKKDEWKRSTMINQA